jgi:glycosyltransferase involved in cell wall biosynthesis
VLPCYNPQPDWEHKIVKAYQSIVHHIGNDRVSLYIVNDGSTSGISQAQIDFLKTSIPSLHFLSYEVNRGKGCALRTGVRATQGYLCIYTDIDFPFEEESFLKVYNALCADEADVIAGVRDATYYKKVPSLRIVISKTLRFFTRTFLGMKVSDTQCGLKGFNPKGKAIFVSTETDRYLFDLEFIHKASNTKSVKIESVLVELKDGIVFSKMNSKILMTEGASFFSILMKHYFSRG